MMVSPDLRDNITNFLDNEGVDAAALRAIIDNVQTEIDREIAEHVPGGGRLRGLNFNFDYNQYNTMQDVSYLK